MTQEPPMNDIEKRIPDEAILLANQLLEGKISSYDFVDRLTTLYHQLLSEEREMIAGRLNAMAQINEELAGQVVATLDGTSVASAKQYHLDMAKILRREANFVLTTINKEKD